MSQAVDASSNASVPGRQLVDTHSFVQRVQRPDPAYSPSADEHRCTEHRCARCESALGKRRRALAGNRSVDHDHRMLGLMQDAPLTTSRILDRADRYFGSKPIITKTVTGTERSTIGELAAAETRRSSASALDSLDISADGRVGTFAWNTARHVALYFAIPGTGRVMHTLNIRYFAEHLIYTVDHAEDEAVFVDRFRCCGLFTPVPAAAVDGRSTSSIMDDGATDRDTWMTRASRSVTRS